MAWASVATVVCDGDAESEREQERMCIHFELWINYVTNQDVCKCVYATHLLISWHMSQAAGWLRHIAPRYKYNTKQSG